MRVHIDSNLPSLLDYIDGAVRRQIPFATAVALTRVAEDGRDEQRRKMGSRFTIRSRRVVRGITINRAEKRDWPRTQAEVGTRDEFIAQHEKGGTKRAQLGAQRVAVPTRLIKRTSGGKVRASQKPRRLRSKRGTFVQDGLIRARVPGQRGRTLSYWHLHERVQLDPRLKLRETITRVASKSYAKHFPIELEKALRPRKRSR